MNNQIAAQIKNVSNEELFAAGYREVSHSEFMALVYRLAASLK
jgi:hypothetical protein